MLVSREEVEREIDWDGPFERVDGLPVYVDWEHSVLDRERLLASRGASAVSRGAGLKGRVRAVIRRLTAPSRVSEAKARQLVELLGRERPSPTVLVVGGGEIGLGVEALYERRDVRMIAFDIYASPHVQFLADAHRIPLRDASVDAVIVQAVLEHVLDPWLVVAEVHRVLRPGGLVYAETPFMQQVHEGPFDFARFSESGHRWLFRGFSRIDSGAVTGPGVGLIWSIDALVRGLFRSGKAGNIAKLAVFWLKYLDRAIPEPYRIDGACGVYFLGRREERELLPREMPAQYLGAG